MKFLKLACCSIAITLVSLLSGCNTVTDFEIYGTVKGSVTDYNTGLPIAGATVMLVPGNQTVSTDGGGQFEFVDLDPAQYTLSVQKSTYQANRKIVDVISGETVNTVIQLTKIPTD